MQEYNRKRIHKSIYDLSPYEYRAALKAGSITPIEVKV
ncbi:hypothetical protein ACFPYJ_18900 [Paenibacillus solisilvae]|uniref:Integrase catalytic domain-containing protein n=1 Tax=Paenibacillus solisilvae TaxID=2486751 RepID=A0ABW0W2G2_9BACL